MDSSLPGNGSIAVELLVDFGNDAGLGMHVQSCPEPRGQLSGGVKLMVIHYGFRSSEMIAFVGTAP